MAVKTAILKGTLYLKKQGSSELLTTGNTTKITLQTEIEEKPMTNAQNPGGGNYDAFKRPSSVKLQCSFREMHRNVLEIAFGAKLTTVAGGAVADEPHNDIVLGSLIPTAKRQDMTAVLTATKGATPLVEGVDYLRKRAGIIPLATSAILVAGDDITVTYTAQAVTRVDGLMYTSQEFGGVFDGINERLNVPAYGEFYRLSFGPASNIELIGDDFVSFDCEAENLADDTKPATASPFYHFELGGID